MKKESDFVVHHFIIKSDSLFISIYYSSALSSSSAIAAAAPDTAETTAITTAMITSKSSTPINTKKPPSVIYASILKGFLSAILSFALPKI